MGFGQRLEEENNTQSPQSTNGEITDVSARQGHYNVAVFDRRSKIKGFFLPPGLTGGFVERYRRLVM